MGTDYQLVSRGETLTSFANYTETTHITARIEQVEIFLRHFKSLGLARVRIIHRMPKANGLKILGRNANRNPYIYDFNMYCNMKNVVIHFVTTRKINQDLSLALIISAHLSISSRILFLKSLDRC